MGCFVPCISHNITKQREDWEEDRGSQPRSVLPFLFPGVKRIANTLPPTLAEVINDCLYSGKSAIWRYTKPCRTEPTLSLNESLSDNSFKHRLISDEVCTHPNVRCQCPTPHIKGQIQGSRDSLYTIIGLFWFDVYIIRTCKGSSTNDHLRTIQKWNVVVVLILS